MLSIVPDILIDSLMLVTAFAACSDFGILSGNGWKRQDFPIFCICL